MTFPRVLHCFRRPSTWGRQSGRGEKGRKWKKTKRMREGTNKLKRKL